MFQRLRNFLVRKFTKNPSVANQQFSPSSEEFSFELLWDDFERQTWEYSYSKLTLEVTNPRLRNWIGSIDRSGYTREKCLRKLITNRKPDDENRILLRLVDWVPQVQSLARDWVLEHFSSLPFEAISANQNLILYLSRKDRLRKDAGMQEIERDLLKRIKGMTPSQFFGLTSMFRRFLFSLSLADDGHLRSWILDDPEPFNRLVLLSAYEFSNITSEEKERLRKDRSVFVRRRFFHSQLESGIRIRRDELISLALDCNRSLRELGQFYLKRNYGEDAYTIYRALKTEEFFYIADYARKEDTEHFLAGIRSGSRFTQHNCLRALVSVSPERLNELRMGELIATSRKFRSTLVPLLPKMMSLEEIMTLRTAFEKSSPHGTINFFRVLEKKSFWAFVDEGLSVLLLDPESSLRPTFVSVIQTRYSICYSPSSKLRESISFKITKLRDADRSRNKGMIDLLEFTLKTM